MSDTCNIVISSISVDRSASFSALQEFAISRDGALLFVRVPIVDNDLISIDDVVMGHILLGSRNDLLTTIRQVAIICLSTLLGRPCHSLCIGLHGLGSGSLSTLLCAIVDLCGLYIED